MISNRAALFFVPATLKAINKRPNAIGGEMVAFPDLQRTPAKQPGEKWKRKQRVP